MACVGPLKKSCKDAFRVAGSVQETCASEMFGGQGADFPRETEREIERERLHFEASALQVR